MGRQILDNLLKLIPTRDEQEALRSVIDESTLMTTSNDASSSGIRSGLEGLSVVDRFLYETMLQPFYLEKLEFLELRLFYQETYSFVDQKLNKIIKCCSMLTHSPTIVRLFELILCIGNYLNQNSRHGDAIGFAISNLTKLCEVKSNRPNFSLLHFLIITIKKKYPDLLNISEELKIVNEIEKYTFIFF